MNLNATVSRRRFSLGAVCAAAAAAISLPTITSAASKPLYHDAQYDDPSVWAFEVGKASGLGMLRLELRKMDAGWAPYPNGGYAISADANMYAAMSDGTSVRVIDCPQDADGAYLIDCVPGSVTITNAQPVSTDFGITNGEVYGGSVTWQISAGWATPGEIVYGFSTLGGNNPPTGSSTKAIVHDPSLPAPVAEWTQMSMGGPEGLGTLRLYIMRMGEGQYPELGFAERILAADGGMMFWDGHGGQHWVQEFAQESDGCYELTAPSGIWSMSGFVPETTDIATTNGTVAGDSISFSVIPGNLIIGYIIYGYQ